MGDGAGEHRRKHFSSRWPLPLNHCVRYQRGGISNALQAFDRRDLVCRALDGRGVAIAAFFALQLGGRVPGMLNYTAGLANLRAACTATEIRTIVTARAFVEQAKLSDIVAALENEGKRFVYKQPRAVPAAPAELEPAAEVGVVPISRRKSASPRRAKRRRAAGE